MILFFDRNVGTGIPLALKDYLKPRGVQIEYHDFHFEHNTHDDIWLPVCGTYDWFVIGQDYSFDENSSEAEAIKTYNVGAFYLWGAEVNRWEKMRCFARGFDNIVKAAENEPRPFIFKVEKHGKLNQVYF